MPGDISEEDSSVDESEKKADDDFENLDKAIHNMRVPKTEGAYDLLAKERSNPKSVRAKQMATTPGRSLF